MDVRHDDLEETISLCQTSALGLSSTLGLDSVLLKHVVLHVVSSRARGRILILRDIHLNVDLCPHCICLTCYCCLCVLNN